MTRATPNTESQLRPFGAGSRVGFHARVELESCGRELEVALIDWSREGALEVLVELWNEDVEALCGQRWKPRPNSKVARAGWCSSDITLGGERVSVRRPRVRSVQGKEIDLPSFKLASRRDLLDRSCLADVAATVTTGRFPDQRHSRDPIALAFVTRLAARLAADHAVPKGVFDPGLLLSPLSFADQAFLGAVGIGARGERRILGLRAGSPDVVANVTGLLDEVISRHVGQAPPDVFVLGEWPALAEGLRERFGRSIAIHRCQHEKRRHVLGLLPPTLQADALEALLNTHALADARAAKRELQKLVRSLKDDHPEASAVLEEGLDETLTLSRMGVASSGARELPAGADASGEG